MVEVVDINVIALEVDEALLALMSDVSRFVGMFGGAWEVSDFGCDDDGFGFYAELIEDTCEHPLRFSVTVDICIVEVIDSGIKGSLDTGCDLIFIDICPAIGIAVNPVEAAHRPASEADFGNGEVGISNLSVVHSGNIPGCVLSGRLTA